MTRVRSASSETRSVSGSCTHSHTHTHAHTRVHTPTPSVLGLLLPHLPPHPQLSVKDAEPRPRLLGAVALERTRPLLAQDSVYRPMATHYILLNSNFC